MSSTEILERISATENLPALPAAAVEVLQLAKRDDASVEDLAAIIQKDPALSAKVLKVVNSSMFGLSREISSIQQAVGLLGLRTVTVLALSFSLVETVDSRDQDGFDYDGFWRASLTTGVIGRALGKHVAKRLAEEAFVCGLLSRIGIVSAWKGVPEVYRTVLDESLADARPLAEIERGKLGFTHAVMSAHLLRKWSLPDTICNAIEGHRGEASYDDATTKQLTQLVSCAARLSDLFCQEVASTQLDLVRDEIVAELGIDATTLDETLNAIEESVRAAAASLSVQIGEMANYEQLKTEATLQIAQLSLQAQAESQRLAVENQRIQKEASIDGLTGLPNRATFDRELAQALQANASAGQPVGLLLLDVDHFKKFNDTYGHRAGDEVLRHVASCLGDLVGTPAIPARYGGEEFAAIVPKTSLADARALAERVRQGIAAMRIAWEGQNLQVHASVGVCVAERKADGLTPEQLIEQADQQLYRAKRGGRNRVEATPLQAAVPN